MTKTTKVSHSEENGKLRNARNLIFLFLLYVYAQFRPISVPYYLNWKLSKKVMCSQVYHFLLSQMGMFTTDITHKSNTMFDISRTI